MRSTIGARRGLIAAAKLISSELKEDGHNYGYSGLFRRLQQIDRRMLGRKVLYNRDVWWNALLQELDIANHFAWVPIVTEKYWQTYEANSLPFRDAEPTLLNVKRLGMKIGLVSDFDGTPGLKRRRIRGVPFHYLFQAIVVAGEDTPRVKPGHESFRLVADRLHLPPQSCVYVADNPRTDIKGATAVGMKTVIVKRRGNSGGRPTYRIPNLSALPRLLETMRTHR